jgi:hypothetical protein
VSSNVLICASSGAILSFRGLLLKQDLEGFVEFNSTTTFNPQLARTTFETLVNAVREHTTQLLPFNPH